MALTTRKQLLKNAYRKVDNMPLSFGMPPLDQVSETKLETLVGGDLDDALREMKINIGSIESMSDAEYYLEIRIVYHIVRRFRNSASVFFKFSTAVDGKTIDKTKVADAIKEILNEYDAEYRKWRSSSSSTSNTWNRSGTRADTI